EGRLRRDRSTGQQLRPPASVLDFSDLLPARHEAGRRSFRRLCTPPICRTSERDSPHATARRDSRARGDARQHQRPDLPAHAALRPQAAVDHRVRLPDESTRPALRGLVRGAGALRVALICNRPRQSAHRHDDVVPAQRRPADRRRLAIRVLHRLHASEARLARISAAAEVRLAGRIMERPVATEQAPPARPPKPVPSGRGADADAGVIGDIRSRRPYVPIRAGVRRAGSIVSLIVLDLVGLVLGVYAALALRDLVYGKGVPLWGFLWKAETDWLPFLTVITVLVFWQAGLYAARERRAGFAQVIGSLVIVAVITMIFAVGTGHRFGTYGLAPTAVVLTSICIGLLRGSYDIVTGDLLKLAGVRRRAILVGEGENLARLRRALGASRGGIEYDFVGAIARAPDAAGLPVLGRLASLPTVLATREGDELIVTDSDVSDRELVDILEQA